MRVFSLMALASAAAVCVVLGIPTSGNAGGVVPRSLSKDDFNGDGRSDLAIGSVRDGATGSINVLYGKHAGLSSTGAQLWKPGTAGVLGKPAADAEPTAMTAGDFNGDGYVDLAFGEPEHYFHVSGNHYSMGTVNVLYGGPGGLSSTGNQRWTAASPGLPADTGFTVPHFGTGLAAGDFNGDGYVDLAIGAPGASVGTYPNAGAVYVLFGSASGLTATGSQRWTQAKPGVPGAPVNLGQNGNPDDGAYFGETLATGNFDGRGGDDLAIGRVAVQNGGYQAGSVIVLYGKKGAGLTATGSQQWSQGHHGLKGNAEVGDAFSWQLAVGNFDGDAYDDLAVSAELEDVGGSNYNQNDGGVSVIYGSHTGLTAAGNQYWTLSSPGVPGTYTGNDEWGAALAAGDFDGDGKDELAVGSWRATVSGHQYSGEIVVLQGSAQGLTATGAARFTLKTPGFPGSLGKNTIGVPLATGDFNHDGRDDLVTTDFSNVGSVNNANRVEILYGSHVGLTTNGAQRFSRATPGVPGAPQNDGGFGDTLE